MSIVDLIGTARRTGWALGEFNMSNLETLQAIVDAANQERAPVIVGVSMGTLRHVGPAYLRGLMQGARAEARTPIFFHLDHGPDFDTIRACIDLGFDSVMIDTSRFTVEENVRRVREVVDYARARGVGVEAQIGETWDEETGEEVQTHTHPEDVVRFVASTGIDYLATSFGNTPGRLEGEAEVDLDLLGTIAAASPVPLVLHGGTSIPDAAARQAIRLGAAKINIDTAIRKAVTGVLRARYGGSDIPSDPRKAFRQAREAATAAIVQKMRLFGSSDRA